MSTGGAVVAASAASLVIAALVVLVAASDAAAVAVVAAHPGIRPPGARGRDAVALVRALAATAGAAGLAVVAVGVLAQVNPDDPEVVSWAWIAASMAVVGAAAAVAARWAGPTRGCRQVVAVVVSISPVTAATYAVVMKEIDPQAGIAVAWVLMLASGAAVLSCALVRGWPRSTSTRAPQ